MGLLFRLIRELLCLTAAVAVGVPICAADPVVVEVPRPDPPTWTEFQVQPGNLLRLSVPQAAKWTLIDSGCDIEPCGDGKRCVFAAPAPGRYRLLAQVGESVVRIAVVVGKPEPPKPPEPLPPPKPVDPAQREFQTAYDADTRQLDKKRPDLLDLLELYKQAAELAAKPEVTTTGQLVTRIREASRLLAIEGLADLRKLIASRLSAAFPSDEPLTAESRKKAAEAFTQIRTLLQGVNP